MSAQENGLHREPSNRSHNMTGGSASFQNQPGDSIPIDHNINHYELPNLTQLLYDFTNKEQDIITRCFRTGNYNSLRDLPAGISPNAVAKFLREKQDTNLAWRPPNPKVETLVGGGLFKNYEWMPDKYDSFLKYKRAQLREHKEKQFAIAGNKPFVLGMNKFTWKYHDCFIPTEKQKDYVMPYFTTGDPYEAVQEDLDDAKFAHDNAILAGDFRPAQADRSLERLTPGQLPDIVNYIKKVIMIDWAEVNFIIGTNPDSFIEIKFDQKSIDTELGLKAYMNTLVKTHDVISQFQLRRIIKFWGYKDGGYIYFMLSPPWIKFNPGITFAGILNQMLDDADKELRQNDGQEGSEQQSDSAGGPEANQKNLQDDPMMFRIHELVYKKTSFIKEPTLYSKDIEV